MEKIKELYKKNKEIINYLIIGGLTTAVNLIVKWILLFTILDAKVSWQFQLSIIISWVIAVIFAYFTNRIFVFESKSKEYLKEITSFVSGRIMTLLLEMGISWFFVTLLKLNTDMWVKIITIACQIIVIILNYIISKLFVFKKDKKGTLL